MTPTQKALITRLDSIGPFPIELVTIKGLYPKSIIRIACKWAQITQDDMHSKRKFSNDVAGRWLVIFALRCRYRWMASIGYGDWSNYYSLSSLKRWLNMHHTTIMHTMEKTLEVMQLHAPELYEFYDKLEQK